MSIPIWKPGAKLEYGRLYAFELDDWNELRKQSKKKERALSGEVGAGELDDQLREATERLVHLTESFADRESSCMRETLWDKESDPEEKLKQYCDLRAHGIGQVKRINAIAQDYKKSASSKIRAKARDFSRLSERYQTRCGELRRIIVGLRDELKRAQMARFSLGMTAQLRVQANTMGHVEQFFMACVRGAEREGFDFRKPLQKAIAAIEALDKRPEALSEPEKSLSLHHDRALLPVLERYADRYLDPDKPVSPWAALLAGVPLSKNERMMSDRIHAYGWTWAASRIGNIVYVHVSDELSERSFANSVPIMASGDVQLARETGMHLSLSDAIEALKKTARESVEQLTDAERRQLLREQLES